MFLEVMNSTNIAKRVEIKVENGIAKSVVKVDSSDSGSVEQYAPYNTIEKIFNIVDRESNVQHDVFTVKYDGTLGYPKNISSDLRRDWADDEWSLNVVSLITR